MVSLDIFSGLLEASCSSQEFFCFLSQASCSHQELFCVYSQAVCTLLLDVYSLSQAPDPEPIYNQVCVCVLKGHPHLL